MNSGLYDQTSVDKLLQECVKMYGLDHPNILTLKGVCLDGGTAPFIILPFMKNGSLLTFLQREKNKLFLTSSEKCENEVIRSSYACMHALYNIIIVGKTCMELHTVFLQCMWHHPGIEPYNS